MIVASALKNLLYLLRYPALPKQSDLIGEFRVGAVQTRIPGATACQIHYPTLDINDNNNNKQEAFVPYFRPQAAVGVANYSRQSASLMKFLSQRRHPCLMGATPVRQRQFPVIIFSHGLGGCMEMYTGLCQHLASLGYWVIALEHEDGSGAYAERREDGTAIYYQRPDDDTPYSRTKVVNFRRSFLAQRVQEITRVLAHIKATGMTTAATNHEETVTDDDTVLAQVWQAADTTDIHFLGHSFGGATMVLAAQDEHLMQQHKIASLSLLDCWAFSLDDDALQRSLSLPTLSVLSQAWLTNPETAVVKQLLRNSDSQVSSFYCPDSVHASFSDAAHWLPGIVGRSLYMRAPGESRHATIRTVAQACAQHIQKQHQQQGNQTGIPNFSGLKEFFFCPDGEPMRQPVKMSAS